MRLTFRTAFPGMVAAGLLALAGATGAQASGLIWTTFVGSPLATNANNGTGSAAGFNQPTGVIVDAAGNVYIADEQNNLIRKATPAGMVTTIAGQAGVAGTNDGVGTNAQFNQPSNIAFDSLGNLFVADTFNHTIRKIDTNGLVSTFAGSPLVSGYNNANGTHALFNQPNGVALDSSNNIYVADGANNAVRRITTNGDVTTVSQVFAFPEQVAIDRSNIIYVADALNNVIRKLTPSGTVTLLAGSGAVGSKDGTGSGAQFSFPESLAVDSASNVFVADYGNDTIRMITPAGVVTTIGGRVGIVGTTNAVGTNALFNNQEGITVDAWDNVYVADTLNNTIRIGFVGPPAIVVPPTNLAATAGTSPTFSVTATGAPPLSYAWFYGTNALTDNARTNGSHTNVLTLLNLSPGSSGAYSVVVTNSYGSTNAGAVLTVLSTPVTINPPHPLANGAINMTFNGGNAGVSYRIQGRTNLTVLNWTDLATNQATSNGLPGFTDLDSTNHALRFYRTITP